MSEELAMMFVFPSWAPNAGAGMGFIPGDAGTPASRSRGSMEQRSRSRSVFRQPQDHVAVALARPAHGAHAVNESRLKPDEIVAIGRAILLNANA
jgi:hypothetical protein